MGILTGSAGIPIQLVSDDSPHLTAVPTDAIVRTGLSVQTTSALKGLLKTLLTAIE